MELIARQMLAEKATKRWKRQYNKKECGHKKQMVTKKLENMKTITPEIVDKIIGNSTWTETKCSECNTYNISVMQFSNELDIVHICKECLIKALKIMRN